MRARIIHLINPKTYSATTRPLYMNRALYSPLAGLLAVAASIPRHSPRAVRSGAYRREYRNGRLRFKGGPGWDLGGIARNG